MTKIMTSLLAGTAFFGLSAVAQAADMGGAFRAPQVVQASDPVSSTTGGWYLRGDVGIGINRTPTLSSDGIDGLSAGGGSWLHRETADTPFLSVGVGYQFSDYLRGDLTAEYRSSTRWRGNGGMVDPASAVGAYKYAYYDGSYKAADVMANAYIDLGTYAGLTPYVGAGIGAAYVTMGDTYQHTSFPQYGTYADGVMPGASKWNLAWALHTGVAWDVNPRLKLEVGYTYKDLGNVTSKELQCNYAGGVAQNCGEWNSLKHIASNDLHIGMRWLLDPKEAKTPAYAPLSAPIVAKY